MKAKKIAEVRGAYFFQPTLFETQNPTKYEFELLNQNPFYLIAQQLKPKFNQNFLANSNSSIDLLSVYINKDLLWDYIHTSAKGNEVIVTKINPYIDNLFIEKNRLKSNKVIIADYFVI